MTLSQIALAGRFDRSPRWIREQGEYVSGITRDGCAETWVRSEYSNGRLAGYMRTSRSMPFKSLREARKNQ